MILDRIVQDRKARLIEKKRRISPPEMRSKAESVSIDDNRTHLFLDNLSKRGISIIGEFKNASPSLGDIDTKLSLEERIAGYNDCVDAISCLTEEDHFKGSIDYLARIRKITPLPILRKDFMIDEYQFYEARVCEADAILLICAILDDARLKAYYELACELGLDALVECHDEYEIERALRIDVPIIGINNRNLRDFSISLETTKRLASYVPDGKVVVAESGIKTDADVSYLKEIGVDGFLIGQALMESSNPAKLVNKWKVM